MNQAYSDVKRVIGFHGWLALAQILLGLTHLLLWRISPAQPLIQKDMERWLRDSYRHAVLSGLPSWRRLAWLLWTIPEFRNLFYYRVLGFKHLAGRLLLVIARWIYPPLPALYLYTPSIGAGLFIEHGFSTVIGARSIGENCWINQQVTIGYADDGGCPKIGNNVRVAAGAVVFGDITIGDNAVIGANALVCKSVPANCTVAGVPAHIIRRNGKPVSEPL